jgi:hypothetical protein
MALPLLQVLVLLHMPVQCASSVPEASSQPASSVADENAIQSPDAAPDVVREAGLVDLPVE